MLAKWEEKFSLIGSFLNVETEIEIIGNFEDNLLIINKGNSNLTESFIQACHFAQVQIFEEREGDFKFLFAELGNYPTKEILSKGKLKIKRAKFKIEEIIEKENEKDNVGNNDNPREGNDNVNNNYDNIINNIINLTPEKKELLLKRIKKLVKKIKRLLKEDDCCGGKGKGKGKGKRKIMQISMFKEKTPPLPNMQWPSLAKRMRMTKSLPSLGNRNKRKK